MALSCFLTGQAGHVELLRFSASCSDSFLGSKTLHVHWDKTLS